MCVACVDTVLNPYNNLAEKLQIGLTAFFLNGHKSPAKSQHALRPQNSKNKNVRTHCFHHANQFQRCSSVFVGVLYNITIVNGMDPAYAHFCLLMRGGLCIGCVWVFGACSDGFVAGGLIN